MINYITVDQAVVKQGQVQEKSMKLYVLREVLNAIDL